MRLQGTTRLLGQAVLLGCLLSAGEARCEEPIAAPTPDLMPSQAVSNIAKSQWQGLFRDFSISFVSGLVSSLVIVLFGVRSIKDFIATRERAQVVGGLEPFWKTASHHSVFRIVCGYEKPSDPHEVEPRLPYSESYGILAISDVLKTIFGQSVRIKLSLLSVDESLQEPFLDDNLVIFGSQFSLDCFGKLSRALGVPYHQHRFDLDLRSFQRVVDGIETEVLFSVIDGTRKLKYDIGSVTRLLNPKNGHLVVLLNGNYAAGMKAAVASVTSPRLYSESQFDAAAFAQQAVVGVQAVQDSFLDPDQPIEIVRPWIPFPLTAQQFTRAFESSFRGEDGPLPSAAEPEG
jgi:hypothetical protein